MAKTWKQMDEAELRTRFESACMNIGMGLVYFNHIYAHDEIRARRLNALLKAKQNERISKQRQEVPR